MAGYSIDKILLEARESARRSKTNFDAIIEKYSKEFEEDDVIDIYKQRICSDRGFVRSKKRAFGTSRLATTKRLEERLAGGYNSGDETCYSQPSVLHPEVKIEPINETDPEIWKDLVESFVHDPGNEPSDAETISSSSSSSSRITDDEADGSSSDDDEGGVYSPIFIPDEAQDRQFFGAETNLNRGWYSLKKSNNYQPPQSTLPEIPVQSNVKVVCPSKAFVPAIPIKRIVPCHVSSTSCDVNASFTGGYEEVLNVQPVVMLEPLVSPSKTVNLAASSVPRRSTDLRFPSNNLPNDKTIHLCDGDSEDNHVVISDNSSHSSLMNLTSANPSQNSPNEMEQTHSIHPIGDNNSKSVNQVGMDIPTPRRRLRARKPKKDKPRIRTLSNGDLREIFLSKDPNIVEKFLSPSESVVIKDTNSQKSGSRHLEAQTNKRLTSASAIGDIFNEFKKCQTSKSPDIATSSESRQKKYCPQKQTLELVNNRGPMTSKEFNFQHNSVNGGPQQKKSTPSHLNKTFVVSMDRKGSLEGIKDGMASRQTRSAIPLSHLDMSPPSCIASIRLSDPNEKIYQKTKPSARSETPKTIDSFMFEEQRNNQLPNQQMLNCRVQGQPRSSVPSQPIENTTRFESRKMQYTRDTHTGNLYDTVVTPDDTTIPCRHSNIYQSAPPLTSENLKIFNTINTVKSDLSSSHPRQITRRVNSNRESNQDENHAQNTFSNSVHSVPSDIKLRSQSTSSVPKIRQLYENCATNKLDEFEKMYQILLSKSNPKPQMHLITNISDDRAMECSSVGNIVNQTWDSQNQRVLDTPLCPNNGYNRNDSDVTITHKEKVSTKSYSMHSHIKTKLLVKENSNSAQTSTNVKTVQDNNISISTARTCDQTNNCRRENPRKISELIQPVTTTCTSKTNTSPVKVSILNQILSMKCNSRNAETLKERNSENLNTNCSVTFDSRCLETLNTRNLETLSSRNSETLRSRNSETMSSRNSETLSSRNLETLSTVCSVTLNTRNSETLSSRNSETLSSRNTQTLNTTNASNGPGSCSSDDNNSYQVPVQRNVRKNNNNNACTMNKAISSPKRRLSLSFDLESKETTQNNFNSAPRNNLNSSPSKERRVSSPFKENNSVFRDNSQTSKCVVQDGFIIPQAFNIIKPPGKCKEKIFIQNRRRSSKSLESTEPKHLPNSSIYDWKSDSSVNESRSVDFGTRNCNNVKSPLHTSTPMKKQMSGFTTNILNDSLSTICSEIPNQEISIFMPNS
ncbi:putative uncharacterized protein DDB_G0282133 [Patella vulgata]|uniref:putative uncharacterized protein DDB_G0282133 n=1 Tax=Patella vulgata TaxID=6465 RepID=UPI00217F2B87|nr:putative uncharacterized protein DDB_G0282133 [Patella vulgata]